MLRVSVWCCRTHEYVATTCPCRFEETAGCSFFLEVTGGCTPKISSFRRTGCVSIWPRREEHIDVVCLILLATSGAIVTEVIDYEAWLGSFWAPKEPGPKLRMPSSDWWVYLWGVWWQELQGIRKHVAPQDSEMHQSDGVRTTEVQCVRGRPALRLGWFRRGHPKFHRQPSSGH
jgi:hypothetical protein